MRGRALLDEAARGAIAPALPGALAALAEHYRGAHARAKRGMGASAAELALVEERSSARARTVEALLAMLPSTR